MWYYISRSRVPKDVYKCSNCVLCTNLSKIIDKRRRLTYQNTILFNWFDLTSFDPFIQSQVWTSFFVINLASMDISPWMSADFVLKCLFEHWLCRIYCTRLTTDAFDSKWIAITDEQFSHITSEHVLGSNQGSSYIIIFLSLTSTCSFQRVQIENMKHPFNGELFLYLNQDLDVDNVAHTGNL